MSPKAWLVDKNRSLHLFLCWPIFIWIQRLELNLHCNTTVGAPTFMIQIFDVQPPILSYFLLFGGWRHQRRLEINDEDVYGKNLCFTNPQSLISYTRSLCVLGNGVTERVETIYYSDLLYWRSPFTKMILYYMGSSRDLKHTWRINSLLVEDSYSDSLPAFSW